MNAVRVCITSEGFIPIPESMRQKLDLKPSQVVILHFVALVLVNASTTKCFDKYKGNNTEQGRLVVEKPSRQQVIDELERLCNELRSGEPLEQIWAEIEAGREEKR